MEYKIARAAGKDGSLVFGFTVKQIGNSELWLRKTTNAAGETSYWMDVPLPSGGLVLYTLTAYGNAHDTTVFGSADLQMWKNKNGYSVEIKENVRQLLLNATRLGIMTIPLPQDEATATRLVLASSGEALVSFQTAFHLLSFC